MSRAPLATIAMMAPMMFQKTPYAVGARSVPNKTRKHINRATGIQITVNSVTNRLRLRMGLLLLVKLGF
ncbi:MAG: hypothetical protein ACOX6V_02085 [Patescibacteria group bacterium]|jgi:hypothetical protein